jgi:exosortase
MLDLQSPSGRAATAGTDRVALGLAAAGVATAVGLCVPAVQSLGYLWQTSEFYGHAYAAPIVAAYLAWGKRTTVAQLLRVPRPPVLGAPLAFAAALLLVLSVMGDAGFTAGLAVPVLLAATLYALGGTGLLRPLLLPLAFLALVVPPPAFLRDALLVRLKLWVTEASVRLLQGAGVTVMAEGNQILIPEGSLFVADACSGLTSIVTMLPIACIVAYFLSRGVWRRAAVVASVVPLAMAGNVLRVIVTVLLASRLGVASAQGSLHESFGLVTYVIGTLAVIGVARVLR